MKPTLLEPRTVADILAVRGGALPAEALQVAAEILAEIREGGESALQRKAEELDGLAAGGELILGREVLLAALDSLDAEARARLE